MAEPQARVLQAIARSRHAGWYRESCGGACPRHGPRACPYLELWEKYPIFLTKKQVSEWLSAVFVTCASTGGPFQARNARWLCLLHRSQAAWRNWGASCEGECCESHDWPDKSIAPLLYLAHTTPRQAVVLLHFGLFKEEDVSRLISKSLAIALLVAHLLHNRGSCLVDENLFFLFNLRSP